MRPYVPIRAHADHMFPYIPPYIPRYTPISLTPIPFRGCYISLFTSCITFPVPIVMIAINPQYSCLSAYAVSPL